MLWNCNRFRALGSANSLCTQINGLLVNHWAKVSCLNIFPQRHINYLQKVSLPKVSLHPTGDEVLHGLSLTGKSCLITGANSGIGFEMSQSLAKSGCDVTLACRNTYAAQTAIRKFGHIEGKTSVLEVDLASFKSVKIFCDKVLSSNRIYDIVILNAGTFGMPYTLTEDNIEATFQVNHLSQFYLLLNLESALAPGARVVFLSSKSHRNVSSDYQSAIITEEMLNLPEKQYTDVKAYNVSKLCNILAVHYLSLRWVDKPLSAFAVHPGTFVKTNLCRNWWAYKLLYMSMIPFSKNAAQGASTPLFCATSLDLSKNSPAFYNNCKPYKESDIASNVSLAFRVYDICLNMLSVRLDLPTSIQRGVEHEVPSVKIDEIMPAFS